LGADVVAAALQCTPMSLALPSLAGKHYWVNCADTPGHPNFVDEVACAAHMCDGALLVVDAVEGVQLGTENAVRQLCQPGSPVVRVLLVINKLDRLIHEQRLPVADAYRKLAFCVDQVNALLPPKVGGGWAPKQQPRAAS
jgi:U5 small nuclear ribonucleoprotein component